MKKFILPFVAFTLTFFTNSLVSNSMAHADDFPNIKEGLWVSNWKDSSGKFRTSKQCIGGGESIKEYFESSKKMLQGTCGDLSVTSSGGSSYTSTVTCDLGISKLTAKSTASGDFQREYTVTSLTKFDPPLMGQGGDNMSIKSSYTGSCGSDMVAGDIILEDGKKMNMKDMLNKKASMTPEQIAQQKAAMEKLKNMDPAMLKQMQNMMKQFQNKGQ